MCQRETASVSGLIADERCVIIAEPQVRWKAKASRETLTVSVEFSARTAFDSEAGDLSHWGINRDTECATDGLTGVDPSSRNAIGWQRPLNCVTSAVQTI